MDLAVITKTRILVVDKLASAKKHLTSPLEQIGFRDIQYLESTSRALLAIEKLPFDLIICAYSIKTEHDGLYFYEQLLQSKLLKSNTGFIFTSLETNFPIVQSIVDLPPDDFIAKPVNAEKLAKRISRLVKRKQLLSPALNFIEQKKYNAALTEIDQLLSYQSNRECFPIALKTKGDLLLLANQYHDAKAYFSSMLRVQPLSWAETGLIKSLIALDQDDEAEKNAIKLACKRESKTVAYELLALLQIKHEKYDEALESTLIAAEISPRNMKRQNTARLLAKLSNDHETEFDITKRMITFAKNSVKESSQLYKNAIRAGIDYAMSAEPMHIQDIMNATKQFLTQLKKRYLYEDHAEEIKVMQVRLLHLENENEKALEIVDQFSRNNATMTDEALLDKAKALHEIGLKNDATTLYKVLDERAQVIVNQIDEQLLEESLFAKLVSKESNEKEHIQLSSNELNKQGVRAFNNRDFGKAFEIFTQALALAPKNAPVALNLLHVISKLQMSSAISELSTQVTQCVNILEQKKLSAEQLKKYKKLRNLLNVQ